MLDAAKFLRLIHGAHGQWFTITSIKGGAIWKHFQNIDKAAYHAVNDRVRDVYVSCGAFDERPEKRGTAAQVTTIAAVWADVDILGPNHKGDAYPPDAAAAMEVVDSHGIKPSITIHSGGGLQLWWLLDEPFEIDGEDSRARVNALLHGWQGGMAAFAKTRGWKIDSTHDLARILRVPGTLNHKGEKPVEVKAIGYDKDAVYRLDVLEGVMTLPTLATSNGSTPPEWAVGVRAKLGAILDEDRGGEYVHDPAAYATAALKAEADGLASCHHERNNALVLAAFRCGRLVTSGWLDATEARRELWGAAERCGLVADPKDGEKKTRDSLDRALREGMKHPKSIKTQPSVQTVHATALNDEARAGVIKELRRLLHIPISRWVQYCPEAGRETYYLHLEGVDQPICMGTAAAVVTRSKFKTTVYSQSDMVIITSSKLWNKVLHRLAQIKEVIEAPEDTMAGSISDLLSSYLKDGGNLYDYCASTVERGDPFIRNGQLFVQLAKLKAAMRREHVVIRSIGSVLRSLGWKDDQVQIEGIHRRYFSTPIDSASVSGAIGQKPEIPENRG